MELQGRSHLTKLTITLILSYVQFISKFPQLSQSGVFTAGLFKKDHTLHSVLTSLRSLLILKTPLPYFTAWTVSLVVL